MAIDITNMTAIRKLTLDDLIDDAVERGDMDALRFLEDESGKKITKTKEDGTTYEINNPIISIRAEYLKKYLGYVPQSKKNAEEKKNADKAKREKARADKFAEAFKKLKAKKK